MVDRFSAANITCMHALSAVYTFFSRILLICTSVSWGINCAPSWTGNQKASSV